MSPSIKKAWDGKTFTSTESGYSHMSGYVSTTIPKTSPTGHPPCSLLHKQAIDVDVESRSHIPEFIHNLSQNAAPPG